MTGHYTCPECGREFHVLERLDKTEWARRDPSFCPGCGKIGLLAVKEWAFDLMEGADGDQWELATTVYDACCKYQEAVRPVPDAGGKERL